MSEVPRALRHVRNAVPSAYRGVAIRHIDAELTERGLVDHFLGLESYRRTRFIVVRGPHDQTALIHVGREDTESLFAPITSVEVLAGPDETAYVISPDADTAIPSSLAAVAISRAPDARAVVVQGRYQHVNFILNPDPIRLTVLEVVPPTPAKLADQAQRLIDVAEDLAPMVLEVQALDLDALAHDHPSASYLLPCRGSDATVPSAQVSYLDERPPRQDWVLLGCERSRQIHEWFYGDSPPAADICPRKARAGDGAVLAKCCLLESTIEVGEDRVVVPWGASMAQVRQALDLVAQAREPEWSAV
ncbi:MAG: DUF7714 family protein [Candidatus Nanopelagicales bacterium]|jgi:hypothetical protein